jgi:hypothetical protein
VGVEVKLIDLRGGEDSVLVKLDEDLEVSSGQAVCMARDRESRSRGRT